MAADLPTDTAEAFLARLTTLRDGSGSGRVAMREIFGLAKDRAAAVASAYDRGILGDQR